MKQFVQWLDTSVTLKCYEMDKTTHLNG